jgi:hypothetical protein
MAGILDQKQRVMDFILTDEGRMQVQRGDLNIEYASLSDKEAFYSAETPGVAADASSRIYFEVNSRYQDKIIIEANHGVITSFQTADYELDGQEIATTPDRARTAHESIPLSGSQAVEHADKILTGITQNFYDNQLIGNTDIFSPTSGFELSEETIVFKPSYTNPINISSYSDPITATYQPPNLNSLVATVADRRFAHFNNFKFMPPVNKEGSSLAGSQLGLYPNINEAEILNYEDLEEQLALVPFHEISFTTTSRANNILIQPFEFATSEGVMKKLDIIDFGVFPNESGTTAGIHVFFIGKLVKSMDGSTKFLNIFTMELDV